MRRDRHGRRRAGGQDLGRDPGGREGSRGAAGTKRGSERERLREAAQLMRHIQGQTDGDRVTARQTSRDGGPRNEGQMDNTAKSTRRKQKRGFSETRTGAQIHAETETQERESRESRRGAQTESGRRSRRGHRPALPDARTPGRPRRGRHPGRSRQAALLAAGPQLGTELVEPSRGAVRVPGIRAKSPGANGARRLPRGTAGGGEGAARRTPA